MSKAEYYVSSMLQVGIDAWHTQHKAKDKNLVYSTINIGQLAITLSDIKEHRILHLDKVVIKSAEEAYRDLRKKESKEQEN